MLSPYGLDIIRFAVTTPKLSITKNWPIAATCFR